MKTIASLLVLALFVAHVQAGPLTTRPSSAGFGRQLLDCLTTGRCLHERRNRDGRSNRERGSSWSGTWSGTSWGGSSNGRSRAHTYAMQNTEAAIEAAAKGTMEVRDATRYARQQSYCARTMDWACLSGHRKMLRAQ